jgi:hypothetical protein
LLCLRGFAGGDGVHGTGGNGSSGGHGVVGRGGAAFVVNNQGGTGIAGIGGDGASGASPGLGIFAIGGALSNGGGHALAAFLHGDVLVTGDLLVDGSKDFKIDHPLDPQNKYLIHAAIESSEVLNVYSGNLTTDEQGNAVVVLPAWFEALNRDFRYQLTVLNTFAQAIVAEKIKGNRFLIKTNAPGVEVSWQVTGVRSDAVMRRHPFNVEEDKPERERGTYLAPEAFGQPEEKAVIWAQHPELMRLTKETRSKQIEGLKTKEQVNNQ